MQRAARLAKSPIARSGPVKNSWETPSKLDIKSLKSILIDVHIRVSYKNCKPLIETRLRAKCV